MVYTRLRLLLLIHPFISSVFFLPKFQTLKIFVALFSGTVRPIKLKLDTHMEIGWVYCLYSNQAATSYWSLISLFFFLSNVQKLKIFITLFSGTVRPRKFKLSTLVDNGWMYCVYQKGCCRLLAPLFLHFSFSPIIKQNFSSHFSQELWGIESWNLIHMWTIGACVVYTGIMLLLLICLFIDPFFFLSNFQLQICLSPLRAL